MELRSAIIGKYDRKHISRTHMMHTNILKEQTNANAGVGLKENILKMNEHLSFMLCGLHFIKYKCSFSVCVCVCMFLRSVC